MKTRFIRIEDIGQIDLAKVSVYDLGNRYIDAQGNMYGLRYDRLNKKIEVIKIIRTPARGAGYFNQQMMAHKKHGAEKSGRDEDGVLSGGSRDDVVALDDEGEGGDSTEKDDLKVSSGEGSDEEFDPDAFINSAIQLMESHKGRLGGIIMNVKHSNIVAQTDKMGTTYLTDVFRGLDMDGVQRLEAIISNQKEMINYPRSLVYYIAKLDTRSKNIIDRLDIDSAKMRFIYYSEMFFSIRNAYRTIKQVLGDLKSFLDEKEREGIARISLGEEKYFQDAMTSIKNTNIEINTILRGCKRLEDFIYNEGRF